MTLLTLRAPARTIIVPASTKEGTEAWLYLQRVQVVLVRVIMLRRRGMRVRVVTSGAAGLALDVEERRRR